MNVIKIINHEDYHSSHMRSDVALLKLERPATLDGSVLPEVRQLSPT